MLTWLPHTHFTLSLTILAVELESRWVPEKLSSHLVLHGDRAKRVPNYNRTTNKSNTDRDADTARLRAQLLFRDVMRVSCNVFKTVHVNKSVIREQKSICM